MRGPEFTYARAVDVDNAVALVQRPGCAFMAGGTDLLQLWKAGRTSPVEVVDISHLNLDQIKQSSAGWRIGTTARLSDVAAHADIARWFPLVSESILATASGQIRNMATIGGNLLQRTRCPYFRSIGVSSDPESPGAISCNKHLPGSGCAAVHGDNRAAAVFGASNRCVATHPSDLAVSLVALEAQVEVHSSDATRRLPLRELHRLPGETPEHDTILSPGDLITGVLLPDDARRFAARSTYLKVRDRASFEFAVISVSAALDITDGVIVGARLAAGGVAPMPWRLDAVEAALVGRRPVEETFRGAAARSVDGAEPLSHNAFKIELLRRSVLRALTTIGGQQ